MNKKFSRKGSYSKGKPSYANKSDKSFSKNDKTGAKRRERDSNNENFSASKRSVDKPVRNTRNKPEGGSEFKKSFVKGKKSHFDKREPSSDRNKKSFEKDFRNNSYSKDSRSPRSLKQRERYNIADKRKSDKRIKSSDKNETGFELDHPNRTNKSRDIKPYPVRERKKSFSKRDEGQYDKKRESSFFKKDANERRTNYEDKRGFKSFYKKTEAGKISRKSNEHNDSRGATFQEFTKKKRTTSPQQGIPELSDKKKKSRYIDIEKNKERRIEKEGSLTHQQEQLNIFAGKENIRLNKYIANAGICARRVADAHIAAGEVTVNGEIITAMGYRVKPNDLITFQGKVVQPGKKVYILLNKPKDYVTTVDDERGRRTVMDLVKGLTEERVYPIGRLDRNTTGLLLLTNDGELAQQLTHPSYEIKKLYHVVLNKNISQEALSKIKDGVELEDGIAEVDDVAYAGTGLKNEVGIELHSGKNRIVRRIFEHLGYDVIALDRVIYADLTKKEIPRGHWRFLTDKEVLRLKHFSEQKPKKRGKS